MVVLSGLRSPLPEMLVSGMIYHIGAGIVPVLLMVTLSACCQPGGDDLAEATQRADAAPGSRCEPCRPMSRGSAVVRTDMPGIPPG